MSFLTEGELAEVGFAALGRNVCISRKTSIYGAARIAIGDNARIDDFCVLSAGAGGIEIGRHVHLAVMCVIMGAEKITLHDFSGCSSRVSIYSSSDDFSGAAMTNPTVPAEFTNVKSRPVSIGRHVIIGAGVVILPGVTIADGSAVGALSLVTRDIPPHEIHAGAPARKAADRKTDFYALEARFNERQG
ncbi:MAG: acyltransferase [Erythrobacter sp.]